MGFNASHSIAAMLFGLVLGYLALAQPAVLFGSWYLRLLGFAVLAAFLVLARAYRFSAPLLGIAVALVCYLASVTLGRS